MELQAKLPHLHLLRASVDALVEADDFRAAAEKKTELGALVSDITQLPVCMFCFVEAPSSWVRNGRCAESWRYLRSKLHCSFCGRDALCDGSRAHMEQIHDSLRRRVGWQLQEALRALPDTCPAGKQRKLTGAIKELDIHPGQGKSIRVGKKEQTLPCLIGQMHMTLERLYPEVTLCRERATLLLALRLLEAR